MKQFSYNATKIKDPNTGQFKSFPSLSPSTDKTLTIENEPADAKIVGDKLKQVDNYMDKNKIVTFNGDNTGSKDVSVELQNFIDSYGYVLLIPGIYILENQLKIKPNQCLIGKSGFSEIVLKNNGQICIYSDKYGLQSKGMQILRDVKITVDETSTVDYAIKTIGHNNGYLVENIDLYCNSISGGIGLNGQIDSSSTNFFGKFNSINIRNPKKGIYFKSENISNAISALIFNDILISGFSEYAIDFDGSDGYIVGNSFSGLNIQNTKDNTKGIRCGGVSTTIDRITMFNDGGNFQPFEINNPYVFKVENGYIEGKIDFSIVRKINLKSVFYESVDRKPYGGKDITDFIVNSDFSLYNDITESSNSNVDGQHNFGIKSDPTSPTGKCVNFDVIHINNDVSERLLMQKEMYGSNLLKGGKVCLAVLLKSSKNIKISFDISMGNQTIKSATLPVYEDYSWCIIPFNLPDSITQNLKTLIYESTYNENFNLKIAFCGFVSECDVIEKMPVKNRIIPNILLEPSLVNTTDTVTVKIDTIVPEKIVLCCLNIIGTNENTCDDMLYYSNKETGTNLMYMYFKKKKYNTTNNYQLFIDFNK